MSKIYFKSTKPQPENSAEDEQTAVQEESVLKEVTAEAAEETAASDAAVAQASPKGKKAGKNHPRPESARRQSLKHLQRRQKPLPQTNSPQTSGVKNLLPTANVKRLPPPFT